MAKWTDRRTAEEKQADRKEKLDSIMQQVVDGTKAVFETERYKQMLLCMAKFHTYSINNIILILLQRPDATLVAGYQAWKTKFHRQVRKGEKGMDILVPAGNRRVREQEKKDENGNPILDENGEPVKETVVSYGTPYFTTRRVFDVSQTDGEPLPTIYNGPLEGSVNRFEDLKEVLMELSPLPVSFEAMEGRTAMGYMSRTEQRIVVRTDISELQTIKTLVHEIAHAQLHNTEEGKPVKLDQRVRETEAESVAFVVCASLGIDTGDYSFPYLAGWSSGKELKELRGSLKRIRQQASENIRFIRERMENRELAVRLEQGYCLMHRSGESWDYSFYDSDYHLTDGGVLDAPDWDIHAAMDELLHGNGMDPKTAVEIEYGSIAELVEAANALPQEKDNALRYEIYQMKEDAPYHFMDFGWMQKKGFPISVDNYNIVYTGQLSADGKTEGQILESLFQTFNVNHPEDFTGHSLSVSDVVVLTDAEGQQQPYFVDTFGFREVPDFLREQEIDQEMIFKIGDRYLLLQPLEPGEGWDYNLLDSDFQMEEGGHLEPQTMDEAVHAVCNRHWMKEENRVQISEKDFEQLQRLSMAEPEVSLRLFRGEEEVETKTLNLSDAVRLFAAPATEQYDSAQLRLTYVKDGLLQRWESGDERVRIGDTSLREQLQKGGAVWWWTKEIFPFLEAHQKLSALERSAQRKVQTLTQRVKEQRRDLTPGESGHMAYNNALLDYVWEARAALNNEAIPKPERPQLQEYVNQTQKEQMAAQVFEERQPVRASQKSAGSLSDKLRRAREVAAGRNQRQTTPMEERQQPREGQKVL